MTPSQPRVASGKLRALAVSSRRFIDGNVAKWARIVKIVNPQTN